MAKKKSGLPNKDEPFSACEKELLLALEAEGLDLDRDIITSRDKFSRKFSKMLTCDDPPEGFAKFRLPFFLRCEGVNFYMSSAVPGTKVPRHSHKNGPVVRFILEGTITYRKTEYSTGDWIYLPPRKAYAFQVGPRGASFILGYCCCCA